MTDSDASDHKISPEGIETSSAGVCTPRATADGDSEALYREEPGQFPRL